MKSLFGFMSPKKAPSPPIVPPPPVDPSYYNMLGALPVAQQFMVLGHIKRLYSGLAAAGTTTYAAAIGTMTPVATAQTSIVGVTPESDRNRHSTQCCRKRTNMESTTFSAMRLSTTI
ncbi:hypothetical protein FRACYDRAFT_257472 [Fragilariopsis cylindrus CCMP1102]|uniref:Uncharacterized protein n=1 Tax=Fragilariopsis cylindrus CCMP1102 TaxID=635003 RepID=A0A1E7EJ35_9STRA|nr:hypothetical protein FRACYDRAFT_257472 [Fragilariopsis cylindrus CCMP1102]|eukprot:OEU05905.1 hypothetical protein FRACYDRAFT_257472 [Fragilariopsis cylindrus CCMP1102]